MHPSSTHQPGPFGTLLRRYRLAAGLSQEELAERAALSQRGISDLERGVRQTPQPATARRLTEALQLAEPEAAALRAAGLDHRRDSTRALPEEQKPHNLPAQLTSFVGRQREQAEILSLLATTRLVTLTGSGGVGKTRLALELGRAALPWFPDGVWLVELDGLAEAEAAAVPHTIASTLGVRGQPGDVDWGLVSSLRSRQLLIVLDNCEHVLDMCASTADRLLRACPDLRILATSREPMGISAETNWPLDCLAVPTPDELSSAEQIFEAEAVRLFVDRARATLPTFVMTPQSADAAARICRTVEGLPLAIELAATRVRVLTVQQIADKLEHGTDLLSAQTRQGPRRHHSLRAALNWSSELLSEVERGFFESLSVFAGGWTLEAAEFVAPVTGDGVAAPPVVDLLSSLIEKSLVVTHPADNSTLRYRMLEPVRQFARERLEDSGAAARVYSRFVDFFTILGERAEPHLRGGAQFADWLDRLQPEQDNLRAALRWCIEHNDAERGLQLGGAVWRLWSDRGNPGEGREWSDLVLRLANVSDARIFRARALNGAAVLAARNEDFAGAQAMLEESLRLCEATGDFLPLGDCLQNLAFIAEHLLDFARARDLYTQALSIQVEHGDRSGEALTLTNFGWSLYEEGDFVRARDVSASALRIYSDLGDKLSAVWSRMALGWALLQGGEAVAAEALFMETLATLQELSWPPRDEATPNCLVGLAATAASHGQRERAVHLFAAAERLREVIGRPVLDSEQGLGDAWLAPLHTAVEEARFAEWWREGRALTLREVVAYALESAYSSDRA